MDGRRESDETLVERLLPSLNPSPAERGRAWCEWYQHVGESSVLAFIRTMNDTVEPDLDILQDAMVTAYQNVERGRYMPCDEIPFTAMSRSSGAWGPRGPEPASTFTTIREWPAAESTR